MCVCSACVRADSQSKLYACIHFANILFYSLGPDGPDGPPGSDGPHGPDTPDGPHGPPHPLEVTVVRPGLPPQPPPSTPQTCASCLSPSSFSWSRHASSFSCLCSSSSSSCVCLCSCCAIKHRDTHTRSTTGAPRGTSLRPPCHRREFWRNCGDNAGREDGETRRLQYSRIVNPRRQTTAEPA